MEFKDLIVNRTDNTITIAIGDTATMVLIDPKVLIAKQVDLPDHGEVNVVMHQKRIKRVKKEEGHDFK